MSASPTEAKSVEVPDYDQPVLKHVAFDPVPHNGAYYMPQLPPQMPELPLHPSLQGKPFNSPPSALKSNMYASAPTPPSSGKKISFNLSQSPNLSEETSMRKTASLTHPKKISFKLPSPTDEYPPVLHQPRVLSHSLNSKKKSSLIYATSHPVDDGVPPLLDRKPAPPRRSENTRLSHPMPTPQPIAPQGADFLKDLQKVMTRKWQVAQKCKQDHTTTPHEVTYACLPLSRRKVNLSPPKLPPVSFFKGNSKDWIFD